MLDCPKCGATIKDYRCPKCYSVVIPRNFIKSIEKEYGIVQSKDQPASDIYFHDRKLCEAEIPLQVGAAKFCEELVFGTRGTLLLTNKSIFFLISGADKEVYQIPLSNVTNASYNGSNLGMSDRISFKTDRNEYRFFVYRGKRWIDNAHSAIKALKDKKEEQGTNKYIEELKGLKQLLEDGIITEQEFETKKKQLLGI